MHCPWSLQAESSGLCFWNQLYFFFLGHISYSNLKVTIYWDSNEEQNLDPPFYRTNLYLGVQNVEKLFYALEILNAPPCKSHNTVAQGGHYVNT